MTSIKFTDKKHMEAGVEAAMGMFIIRAREAGRDAIRYRKLREDGVEWAFTDLLRSRAERTHWIWAARVLRDQVSAEPRLDVVGRRKVARILKEAA